MMKTPDIPADVSNVQGHQSPPSNSSGASSGPATGASDQPAGANGGPAAPSEAAKPMAPGDEAPPGTPGTGEGICPDCGGSGKRGGSECPTCEGTGHVIVGIGGA